MLEVLAFPFTKNKNYCILCKYKQFCRSSSCDNNSMKHFFISSFFHGYSADGWNEWKQQLHCFLSFVNNIFWGKVFSQFLFCAWTWKEFLHWNCMYIRAVGYFVLGWYSIKILHCSLVVFLWSFLDACEKRNEYYLSQYFFILFINTSARSLHALLTLSLLLSKDWRAAMTFTTATALWQRFWR